MISVSCTTTRALVEALDKKIPIHECHHQLSLLKKNTKKVLSFFIYILAQKYKTNIETINNRITISLFFISFKKKRILLVVLKIYVFVGAFVVQFYTSNSSLV